MTMTKTKTKFVITIKTEPHKGWMCPSGWGPYDTYEEAERARIQADKLWMAARVIRVEAQADEVTS